MSLKLPDKDADPILQKAIEEIKSIIRKYDIAGSLLLHSREHSEFLMEISPSWSCMTLEHVGQGNYGLRFKAALATGAEAEKERATWTVGMVVGLCDETEFMHKQFVSLAIQLGKHLKIDHVSKTTPADPDKK